MATASGGKIDTFDLGGGVNSEAFGVERRTVLAEASMLLCIARVLPGFGEVA